VTAASKRKKSSEAGMLSLYRTLSLRYLQQRWSRAVLIVASIALGVGLLVGTRSINESMWDAARSSVNPLAVDAPLYVSNGDSGVPRDLVPLAAAVPGVKSVEPLVFGRVRVPDLVTRQAPVIGIVWRGDVAEDNPWGVHVDWLLPIDKLPAVVWKKGNPQSLLTRLPGSIIPVLVGADLAKSVQERTQKDVPTDLWRLLQRIPGSRLFPLRVQAVGREPVHLIAVGTVHAEGEARDLVKNALILNAADAARLLGRPDLFTRVDVFLAPDATPDEVRGRIAAVVRDRATVRTLAELDQRVQNNLGPFQLGFALIGAGGLVVGLFLIYLVLAVSVAERRHEVGILRSLGATRPQVWGLFVGEALLLGALGTAVGIPTGLVLARYLGFDFIKRLLSDFMVNVQQTSDVRVSAETLVIAVVAGVVTAVLAALVPAVQAVQEEPASAVRRTPPRARWGYRTVQLLLSLGLMAAGVASMMLRQWLPARFSIYGGFVLVLLGLLLTTPLLVSVISRVFQPAARWVLGISGRLAADNLVRAPRRTGLVITVLAAGVAMFLQTAGVVRSNQEPILEWVERTLDADLFVSSGSPIIGSGQNLLLEATLGPEIQRRFPEQVQAALGVRTRTADLGNDMVLLVAIDAAGFDALPGGHGLLRRPGLYRRLTELGPDRVVVSENFAALYRVRVGDVIRLGGPRGPVPLEVAGVVRDYSYPRGTVIMDLRRYAKTFDDPLVDEFFVYLRPGADEDRGRWITAVSDGIAHRWGADYDLVIWDRAKQRQMFLNTMDRFSVVAYSQELVVGVVAALGLAFALLISVIQRRRELGILRAIGATQQQVLRSVLAEAALMGAIGSLIGLCVGVPMEWYIMTVIVFEETGCVLPTLIPWLQAGVIVGVGLVIATLAGVWPAVRTMHLRIPEAIAYE
jgi:putative ABC transport system permease protein